MHVVRANKDRKPKVLNLKKKVKHMKTQAKGEYRRRSFEKTQTDRAVLMLDNPHKTGNT